MMEVIRELFSEVVDYAGLFPPAGCDMRSAVRNYAVYRESEYAWLLSRFVVPVARLAEFSSERTAGRTAGGPWRLSALCGVDLAADLDAVADFNAGNIGTSVVDTIEYKANGVRDIEMAMKIMPGDLTPYFELAPLESSTDAIRLLAELGGRVKARTGGVTADAFPSAASLAVFLEACAAQGVAFKATAGLHHALRSVQRLTYAPDSATALMHGFVNVFLAGCFARAGMPAARIAQLLEEQSPKAFRLESSGVRWQEESLTRTQLTAGRAKAAIAFGSCSFDEPVQELRNLGWL